MQSYHGIIEWLYGLQRFGVKLGLEKIEILLRELGNPESGYPAIHIAGTNGKGSVASMIAAILQATGLKVGLYTSPHITRFSERIKVNGREISDEAVIEYSSLLQKHVDGLRATFFETTTAMALQYFADEHIDVAVIETGMGGRFDATNIVNPVVSVITSIGLEHQQYLGNTLSRIAYEKGGIIKHGVPVVSGVQSARAIEVLKEIAGMLHSPIIEVLPSASAVLYDADLTGTTVDLYFKEAGNYDSLHIGLGGIYQIQNAMVAVRVIDVLRGRAIPGSLIFPVSDDEIRTGLSKVREYTGLRGRMQLVKGDRTWIFDVAHNPGALRELVKSLGEYLRIKIPVVFGVLNDKDIGTMLRYIARIAGRLYLVQPRNERAVPSDKLRALAQEVFFPAFAFGDVGSGIGRAAEDTAKEVPILVTGSHFVVGEAMDKIQI